MPKESESFGKLSYKEFYADSVYIPAMSEAWLYLNIWVPDRALQENIWSDFMKYGTPDRAGDIWKPYRENDKYIKEFR